MTTLITATPYSVDVDLGAAQNQIMEMLPEDGWACLLDHDVMFTTRDWYKQLLRAIHTDPEGCFAGVTNRIVCPFQNVEGVDMKNHDMWYHRDIGKRLLEKETIRDVTNESRTPSGFLTCLSKKAWREIGGFPHGFYLLDKRIWTALKMVGRRLYVIEGLYLYHWHRGGGANADPWVDGPPVQRHVLPDGRVLEAANMDTLLTKDLKHGTELLRPLIQARVPDR